jgi:hypothetical protein
MDRPMTEAEEKRYTAGIPREKIVLKRIWNKRPDGFAIKMPTTETESALERTLNPQGWTVSKRSFIAGVRSLNEKARKLHDNLTYFKVPQAGIESIRSKLAFKIFDEYANILKGMYSMRFNGCPKDNDDHDQMSFIVTSV